MQRLKLAASKIPIELMERLNRLTELTGLTQSAAIRQAIEFYLDNAELTELSGLTAIEGDLTPSQPVTTDNPVYSRLTDIEARLAALESRSMMTAPTSPPIAAVVTKSNTTPKNKPNTTPKANTKKAPAAPTSPASPPIAITKKAPAAPAPDGAMTMGELFVALGDKYPHTQKSLSRRINKKAKSGTLPDELVSLGLSADFEVKRAAKSSASDTRWLYLR
jgi:hypothetical protein